MLQVLAAFVTVAIPAVIALGSTRRRRLSLLRDEVTTYEALRNASLPVDLIGSHIELEVEEYIRTHGSGSEAIFRTLMFGGMLGYSVLLFAVALGIGGGEGTVADLLGLDDGTRERVAAYLVVVCGFIFSAVTIRLLLLRRRYRRRAQSLDLKERTDSVATGG